MLFKRFFHASTLLCSAAAILTAAHFDDKVRNDYFAGIAGDKAALERAMAASEDAITNDPSVAAEAKSWHGTGLLVLSGQKFQQGDAAAGGELWARAIREMDEAGRMEPDNPAVLIPRAAAWFAASRTTPPKWAARSSKRLLRIMSMSSIFRKPILIASACIRAANSSSGSPTVMLAMAILKRPASISKSWPRSARNPVISSRRTFI